MKKIILVLCAALICMGADAQKRSSKKTTRKATPKTEKTSKQEPTVTGTDAEVGKYWFDAERYPKAIPYIQRAMAAGDVDSKARYACMLLQGEADGPYGLQDCFKMLDECIEKGSVFALERKGFFKLRFAVDNKDAYLEGFDLYKQASDKGYADASAELWDIYRDGYTSFATGEYYIRPDDALAKEYLKKAFDQGSVKATGYVGWYTYKGDYGYEKDEAKGIELMKKAYDMNLHFFATDCLEAGKFMVDYLKNDGQTAKANELLALLKKFHPQDFRK